MIETDILLDIANEHGIEVRYESLFCSQRKLYGYAWPSRKLIVLEVGIMGTRQEKCVLAEEVGHCLYPPIGDHELYHSEKYYTIDPLQRAGCRSQVAKDERVALRWATDFLISDSTFFAYFDTGPHELWEWCDHFEVEPWFMALKIGYMLQAGGRPGGRPFRRRDAVRPGIKKKS